jgi:hypothetical protein
MKLPEYYSQEQSTFEDYSVKQFELAEKFDDNQYFKYVKKILKSVDEDPEVNLSRQLQSLCVQANDRVEVVASGEAYRQKIKGRCMDYKEFDEYSTPARDGRFFALFNRLKEYYTDYQVMGLDSQVDQDLLNQISNIFSSENIEAYEFCNIKYQDNSIDMNLSKIYQTMVSEKLSSHPNDNIHRRWGVSRGEQTNCKKWY